MADLSSARILITGGAGFIGSHIVDELLKEDVSGIVIYDNFIRGSKANLTEALKDPRVVIFPVGGDILSTDVLDVAMKGVDIVFHTAALWILHCNDYPRSAFNTNIQGTFNVIEACVRNHVEKLIFSSSASVYGNAITIPMTEDHPYNNRTFYGATKIACEHMLRATWERYGFDYIGLRYMNVYGNRQDYLGVYINVIMKMIDNISQGINPIVYGDGSETFDFVYVTDVARANILAAKSSEGDVFYNVGSGVGTTLKDLAEMILELTGSNLEIDYCPKEQMFVTKRIGSTEKAEKELGFKASVGLKDGLSKLIQWRIDNEPLIRDRRERGDMIAGGM